MSEFAFDSPHSALEALLAEVTPLDIERVPLRDASGRALAESIRADRDSPACDVSAMDGFAVRCAEVARGAVTIAGAIRIGSEPPALAEGTALRIVTGAAIPAGADAVVKHEQALVDGTALRCSVPPRLGDHIRRRGENARHDDEVLASGALITAPVAAALATFGVAMPRVFRRVRVAIVGTGDELDATPDAFHLRDSNGPALATMFRAAPWCDVGAARHAVDDDIALRRTLATALDECDALFVTGGVSMGERDFVPSALQACGVRVIFHRLPQRPGKPLLAGIANGGQPVLALPGNPVSVLVTARRFGVAALRRRAGIVAAEPIASVALEAPDAATIPFWWHRAVKIVAPGRARLIATRGSGDVASAATSDGFVEMPPMACGAGPWPFFSWGL